MKKSSWHHDTQCRVFQAATTGGNKIMEYVPLGRTGLKVSRLCLGAMTYGSKTWQPWILEEEESRPLIRQALECGINFFDTADVYSRGESEKILGRALRDFGPSRDRLVIATKVFHPMSDDPNDRGLSRKHIFHSIDNSLERLGTDYVDLYQIHRFDPTTPVEETLRALDDVVRCGKALYVGASSMYAWQFAKMLYTADRMGVSRFVTMQNHYNLVYREEEREMNPLCQAEGVGLIPWSPLARGFLAGNRNKSETFGDTLRAQTDKFGQTLYFRDSDFRVVDRVTEIARRRRVSNIQISLAWVLHQPNVAAPIIGTTKSQHLEEAIAALSIRLDESELQSLAEPYEPHPILGHS
jgi:aryl-alcohol dehydrogenase-like predicted oxidoreductase